MHLEFALTASLTMAEFLPAEFHAQILDFQNDIAHKRFATATQPDSQRRPAS
jgi:hypothetical protein